MDMTVICLLRIKRKGECKREKEREKRQKSKQKRKKMKETERKKQRREIEREKETGQRRKKKKERKKKMRRKICTAGRAKKEIPKRAQPDATNFPAHVRGTVSPYPTVHSVICRLLYQRSDQ